MTGFGVVRSLHIAAAPGDPPHPVAAVWAVAGRGLLGDRNYRELPGDPAAPERGVGRASGVCQISLIELEAIEALEHEHGVRITASESRRNVVCTGVRLLSLVGKEFQVGEVTLRGQRPSEPCARLEQLTRPGVLRGLIHRGGLRAEILRGGLLRVGDPLWPAEAPRAGQAAPGRDAHPVRGPLSDQR
ncbi:MOSC domain-containing protein [Streptomyces sp. NPDC093109]|uniref:MOSC domain-containing protein n=1 Tax=Streptomyces sp. NPDC093109 TaxID=3154977 RepID=UPI00344F1415